MDIFEYLEKKDINISNDEHIAKKILNICSKDKFSKSDYAFILSIKAKHICLAKKFLNEKNKSNLEDMVLFEYLEKNILGLEEIELEEEVYL